MSGIQIADAKAPWINFETRPEEDREKSIQEGRFVSKDVDYVLITPHGSRDRIERQVHDWLSNMEQQVKEQRLPADWLNQYRKAYQNWKEGKAIPLEGTPIANWAVLSPSQVRMLQDLHILTVEVLAQANEETIRRLGMGGRNLVDKAVAWVKQASTGKVVEENAAMLRRIEALEQTNQMLLDQNQAMKAQLNAQSSGDAAQAPASSGISSTDLLDQPETAPKRKL